MVFIHKINIVYSSFDNAEDCRLLYNVKPRNNTAVLKAIVSVSNMHGSRIVLL